MKKLLLLILLSLGLTTISYGDYLDNWTDNELCGWMDNPPPPAYIIAEVNMRGLYCDDGVAIKKVKTAITKDLFLESELKRWKSKLKSWNRIIRGKKPIYTTKGGNQIKVNPFSDEQSIKLIKPF